MVLLVILLIATVPVSLAVAKGGGPDSPQDGASTSGTSAGKGAGSSDDKAGAAQAASKGGVGAGSQGTVPGKATGSGGLPQTGEIQNSFSGGWGGLCGGFIGDFGPQYNTYPSGFGMESVNMYGPLGMYGQYGMYGPCGMYGPAGPSFGSGLGFGGFGQNDPWALYKQYNIDRIAEGEKPATSAAEAAK